MNTQKYLDLYKNILKLPSDYAIHQCWDVSRSYISKLRRGEVSLTEAQCEEIAKATRVPLPKILADISAERAKSPALRAAWRQISQAVDRAYLSAGVIAAGSVPLAVDVMRAVDNCILCQTAANDSGDVLAA